MKSEGVEPKARRSQCLLAWGIARPIFFLRPTENSFYECQIKVVIQYVGLCFVLCNKIGIEWGKKKRTNMTQNLLTQTSKQAHTHTHVAWAKRNIYEYGSILLGQISFTHIGRNPLTIEVCMKLLPWRWTFSYWEIRFSFASFKWEYTAAPLCVRTVEVRHLTGRNKWKAWSVLEVKWENWFENLDASLNKLCSIGMSFHSWRV
jgi:hypothetical protein